MHLQNLSTLSDDEFIAAFNNIPMDETELNLSANQLGKRTNAVLKAAFYKIPNSVSSLDLSDNDFDQKSGRSFILVLGYMPAGLKTVYIGEKHLCNKSTDELTKLFKYLEGLTVHVRFDGASPVEQAKLLNAISGCSFKYHHSSNGNSTFLLNCLAGLILATGVVILIAGILSLQASLVIAGVATSLLAGAGLAANGFFSNNKPIESTTQSHTVLTLSPALSS